MLDFMDIPVRRVRIEAVAITKEGNRLPIPLPPHSRFAIKIGFYNKST